jgi:hypothetical protein
MFVKKWNRTRPAPFFTSSSSMMSQRPTKITLGFYRLNLCPIRSFSEVLSMALIRLYVPSVVRRYVCEVLRSMRSGSVIFQGTIMTLYWRKCAKLPKALQGSLSLFDFQTSNLLNMKQGFYKLDREAMYCHVSGVP